MTTTIKRCKHCHKTYYYYLSGYHQYNNENYCPECQEIIEKALSNVPVKYTGKYQEITFDDDIFKKMQYLKATSKYCCFFAVSIGLTGLPYDDIETYTINNKKYAYVKTDDGEHMYRLNEYDIANDCYTGNIYEDDELLPNSFGRDRQRIIYPKADDIKIKEFKHVNGNAFYLDYNCLNNDASLQPEAFETLCEQLAEDQSIKDIDSINGHIQNLESNIKMQTKINEGIAKLGKDLRPKNDPTLPSGKLFYLDF
ncbi:MAG: hypothetical protein [Wendovervirus sonii]|uniref:Uncharacterized protein n=1 Tax=phage Lak_Megaphage_Sonny TaxID=3109229 RepID=A0ABZ0Z454_9CAUD|nr:MAG: hypothetical protein [phage Lak_Megaphage_Sonny]